MTGWWLQPGCLGYQVYIFLPTCWNDPIWRTYFSDGWFNHQVGFNEQFPPLLVFVFSFSLWLPPWSSTTPWSFTTPVADRNLLLPMHNISPMLSWLATTSKNPWRASVLLLFFAVGGKLEDKRRLLKIGLCDQQPGEILKNPSKREYIENKSSSFANKELIQMFCCHYSNLKKPAELFGSLKPVSKFSGLTDLSSHQKKLCPKV